MPVDVRGKDAQAYKTTTQNVISHKGCEPTKGVQMKESEISQNASLVPSCKSVGREGREETRQRKETLRASLPRAQEQVAVGSEGFY